MSEPLNTFELTRRLKELLVAMDDLTTAVNECNFTKAEQRADDVAQLSERLYSTFKKIRETLNPPLESMRDDASIAAAFSVAAKLTDSAEPDKDNPF